MGILSDNYKNHSVHQEIETILKFIEDYKQRENLTDANKDSLEAYEQLLVYAQYVLNNCLTQVVPTQLLSNLQSNISSLQSNNVLNIETTYNIYSNITSDLSRIPVYKDKNTVKISVGKIIENFNTERDDIKKSIADEIDRFKKKQEDELNKWIEEKERYEKQLEELNTENASLKTKLEDLTQKIKDEHINLEETISDFKSNYEENIETFKNEFKENQKTNQETFEKETTEMKSVFDEFHNSNKTETDSLLEYMISKQKDVERLWGIIGKATVSGSSQSYANRAKNFAHTMMGIALFIMLGVIIFLAITFYKDISSPNFNPINLLYRIPLGFTLFLPAWYCASIANKQRNREFQLRDFEIKTAGLEPFMENMRMVKCNNCDDKEPSNKKDETKLELVKEIFTKDLDKNKVDDRNIIIPKEIVMTIQSCLETWSKIKKKG